MGADYVLLAVRNEPAVTIATLTQEILAAPGHAPQLRQDLEKLAAQTTPPVVLDLRPAQRIDVSIVPEVLRFNRYLQKRSLRLLVCVTSSVKEVLTLARLDRVFDIAESYDGWPTPPPPTQ